MPRAPQAPEYRIARDLSTVIPTFNRTDLLAENIGAGRWDNHRLLVVGDGVPKGGLDVLTPYEEREEFRVIDSQPNGGVAHAIGVGVRAAETADVLLCGDDDYYEDSEGFLDFVEEQRNADLNALFLSMPQVWKQIDGERPVPQFDRSGLDGLEGADFLRMIVEKGEIRAMAAGTVLRRTDLLSALPESFFEVSEDYLFLARIAASNPTRCIRMSERGNVVRRLHDASLSWRAGYTENKALCQLIAMAAAGRLAFEAELLTQVEVVKAILAHGQALQRSYGLGVGISESVGAHVGGMCSPSGEEQRWANHTLAVRRDELPPEWDRWGSHRRTMFSAPNPAPEDITLIIPSYNRVERLAAHLDKGKLAHRPVLVVDDGSDQACATQLAERASAHGLDLIRHSENAGAAAATATAIREAATSLLFKVDDDDHLSETEEFVEEARKAFADDPNVLFATAPRVNGISAQSAFLQYDRRDFHGMTGRDLLRMLVDDGEMSALGVATVFRREDLLQALPEPLFRMAHDFTYLCRLCARFPDRRIVVTSKGTYFRSLHDESITASATMGPEKMVMHLLSLLVGFGLLHEEAGPREAADRMRIRGQRMLLRNGLGDQAARVLEKIIMGEPPELDTSEARQAFEFLCQVHSELPREILRFIPGASLELLRARHVVADSNEDIDRDAAIDEAVRSIEAGDVELASEQLAQLAESLKDDPQVPALLGTALLLKGDRPAALRQWSVAAAKHPDLAVYPSMIANMYEENGKAESAASVRVRLSEAADYDGPASERPGGPRLAMVVKAGMDQFLDDLLVRLYPEFQIRKFVVDGTRGVEQALEWADVAWFEWVNEPLVHATNRPRRSRARIVTRLHRYEAFRAYPSQVNWSRVDELMVVNGQLVDIMKERIVGLERQTRVSTIVNGVDVSRYPFKEREQGYNLAYLGYIHARKNPGLMLQVLERLVRESSKYKLHVAGRFQDPLQQMYWAHMIGAMGLTEHVQFDNWVEDIAGWLEDKQYLIATTIHESFGYGIAEAMARGIKPVVHNFVGADGVWAHEMLFNTVDEAAAMVLSPEYTSAAYRAFIAEHYHIDTQVAKTREVLHRALDSGTPTSRRRVA